MKRKTTANTAPTASSLPEAVLRDVKQLYIQQEGLIEIAANVGIDLLPPREKITTLLIGNHSAGKSSFINWYVEEHVQRTGVAMETSGFCFVTQGKKRDSLTGPATLRIYPHFKPLADCAGVVDCIRTEITTSKCKQFPLVTFVDTPGLVDGDMSYPFDVDQALLWLGKMADLILVFFDPMGQALCKHTLDVVEALYTQSENEGGKVRFLLSKADAAGTEKDRQKVITQITQNLCKRPAINKIAFEILCIYHPGHGKESKAMNQLDEVCSEIDKTISHAVQNTLNLLEKDCAAVATKIRNTLADNKKTVAANSRARARGILFYLSGFVLPLLLSLCFIARLIGGVPYVGDEVSDVVLGIADTTQGIFLSIPSPTRYYLLGSILMMMLVVLVIAKWVWKVNVCLTKEEIEKLERHLQYVNGKLRDRKEELYDKYLQESVGTIKM